MRGRLELDRGAVGAAEGSLGPARRLLDDTGFTLRRPLLLIAEASLAAANGRSEAA